MYKISREYPVQHFHHIFIQRDSNDIAWFYFDQLDSSTNVLSTRMLLDMDRALVSIEDNPPAALIFLSNKSSGFIAGADVTEFMDMDTDVKVRALIGRGQSMLNRIEALPFKTVALIHGFCLGGGLELALSCNYRIACEDENTKLGLPEVLLGIHPGFGGSARLTRLIGPLKAMPIMLSGRHQDAVRACKLGIVNEVVPRRHINTAAITFIQRTDKYSRAKLFLPKLSWAKSLVNSSLARFFIAKKISKQLAQKVNKEHYPAPYALIDLWKEKGGNIPLMIKGEVDSIVNLFSHPSTNNLVRIFLLQEKLKKLGKEDNAFSPKHVHVIGAGVMGGDIAIWCVLKGMRVTLQDREAEYIKPALARANKLFTKRIKNPYERQAAFDRLIPDPKGYGIEKADVVIEAIIENLEAKVALYKTIEPRLKPDAILATNTSSIPLQDMASQLEQPERLIGLHFFNPVAKMQLIEVIKSDKTDHLQIAKGMHFSHLIGRLPLPTFSSPGFLVNRVLLPYLLEAIELINDGIPASLIDKVATDFGMPIGPIHLADTVGLDICHSVATILSKSLPVSVPDLLTKKITEKKFGIKSGEGFYLYKNGQPVLDDPASTSPIDLQKVEDRLILRLLNESVAVLQEGVIENADLLDAGMIFGTGFAPFRGGPMQYAKTIGADKVRQSLLNLETEFGERFRPNMGWDTLKIETDSDSFH